MDVGGKAGFADDLLHLLTRRLGYAAPAVEHKGHRRGGYSGHARNVADGEFLHFNTPFGPCTAKY